MLINAVSMDQSSDDYAIMVAISIGVLTFIFLCALLGLLLICRRHTRRLQQTQRWSRFGDERNGRPSKKKKLKKTCTEPELAMALNDIGLGSALDRILNDEQWMDDASGVIPHCLAILRTCHALTERLAELAMRPTAGGQGNREGTVRLIEATKRVPFRVDDVVRSMYPPFDLRLLEARLAALVLAVGQVALLTQNISMPGGADSGAGASAVGKWIDEGMNDMDAHLLVLRKIGQQQTADEQSGASRVYLNSSQV